jgi:flagellum-specific peptidoglycan hydrolase FlgJ
MISPQQQRFLETTAAAAQTAGHIFPGMAACEACDESAWGSSQLAVIYNNLFGMKQQVHPIYGTIDLPTREFIHGAWITEQSAWVVFPTLAACFASRMATLQQLKGSYPHYADALAATTPEGYVTAVSMSWSTDPDRAQKCIEIYHAHLPVIESALAASVLL